ncbi:hypothetical protein [Blastomonas sp.]|uniref:hypothetical protein n=1 Tax=Blastomonas sp. TaxID=1909299 RepID=UPI00406A7A6F
MAHPEGSAADQTREPWTLKASREEPFDHQQHPLAASLRRSVARRSSQIRQLEHDLSPGPALERSRGWETVAVTLAEIMADSGHASVDSTTVRAHVSAAG